MAEPKGDGCTPVKDEAQFGGRAKLRPKLLLCRRQCLPMWLENAHSNFLSGIAGTAFTPYSASPRR